VQLTHDLFAIAKFSLFSDIDMLLKVTVYRIDVAEE